MLLKNFTLFRGYILRNTCDIQQDFSKKWERKGWNNSTVIRFKLIPWGGRSVCVWVGGRGVMYNFGLFWMSSLLSYFFAVLYVSVWCVCCCCCLGFFAFWTLGALHWLHWSSIVNGTLSVTINIPLVLLVRDYLSTC